MKEFIYGIDFGTSNSTLSILDKEENKIVKTFNDSSVIFFPELSNPRKKLTHFVGREAIENYSQSKMKGRFMKSVKRVLPRSSFSYTQVYNRKFTASELVSLILAKLKKDADEFIGQNISSAILGRPVIFDADTEKDKLAQDRLLKAAKLAGFKKIFFQYEPIAAAFAYERTIEDKKIVLVGDFGGGTSDFSIVELDGSFKFESTKKQELALRDGIYIGGDNFDSDIMWEKGTPHFGRELFYDDYGKKIKVPITFFLNITSWEKMNFFNRVQIKNAIDKYYHLTDKSVQFARFKTLIEKNLGFSIFQSVEAAKIQLSSQKVGLFKYTNYNIDIEERIQFLEFQSIIKKNINAIEGCLVNFLKKSNIKPEMIDRIFLTGGSSLVIPIQEIMKRHFTNDKIIMGDSFNSVSNGLAYSYTLFDL